MPGKRIVNDDRARRTLAQEAARLIVDHGIRDYRAAKIKAAERLGMSTRRALPRNAEIELAVSEHLQLYGGDSHKEFLRAMRQVAFNVMRLLDIFSPRLVGPVLIGTADGNTAVNLHVFADSPEAVALQLSELDYRYRPYERRLKISRGKGATAQTFAGFQFDHEREVIEATVFPVDGIRQAPISPIDGRPMQRADRKAVASLISG